ECVLQAFLSKIEITEISDERRKKTAPFIPEQAVQHVGVQRPQSIHPFQKANRTLGNRHRSAVERIGPRLRHPLPAPVWLDVVRDEGQCQASAPSPPTEPDDASRALWRSGA